MPTAKKVRSVIDTALLQYESDEGAGTDAYCTESIIHPMAEGKYLQILAALRRANLLSPVQLELRTNPVLERLQLSALRYFDDVFTWGLGFSHRELLPDEPFLITSAIVTRGVFDCHQEGLSSGRTLDFLKKAVDGLRTWVQKLHCTSEQQSLTIPAYSPNIREVIYNAPAYALATLKLISEIKDQAHTDVGGWLHSLEWLNSRRIVGLGWPYSPESQVVDLLHQCYLLNSFADVFGVKSIEIPCAEMVGQFAGPCCFADALRIVETDCSLDEKLSIPWVRKVGETQVELLPKPARLWSLGELLVLVSRLGEHGDRSVGWIRLCHKIAETILERLASSGDVESQYPRHVMHALHGLASYLALLRKKAQLSEGKAR